jgi:hypothetical protein
MKTSAIFWSLFSFALICQAQEPRPTPIPTPRVIILLEKERQILEHDRAAADKSYSSGKIDKEAHTKSMQNYKEGIAKYRSEVRAGGHDK